MLELAIKATETEYTVEILAVPFGSPANRDSDGQYFAPDTNLHLDKFPNPPLVYFHGYDNRKTPSAKPAYIGKTTGFEVRPDGVWFRGVLDKANEYARRVWEAAKQGVARASSGSVVHLVRYARDGKILEWPLAELSVFDAVDGRNPANRHAVVMPALKAIYAEAGLDLPDLVEQQEWTMEPQELNQLVEERVQAAIKADREAQEAQRKAEQEVQARIDAAVKAEREKVEAEAATDRRLPGGGEAPYVAKFGNIWKYDDLEPADIAVGIGVLDAAKRGGRSTHGATEDMRRALAVRLVDDKDEDGEYVAAKSAMKMAGMPLKANELNQSTLATFGDEWVGVTYSTQLWDKIRLGTPVLGRIPTVQVPQGSESIVVPLMGASPTFYKVAQASAQASNPGRVTPTVTTSKLGTGNQTITVGKLGAAVNYTGELEEDSLIPWLAELRRDMTSEATEVLEHIVIDGDTATDATTNINDIGGTPAGAEAFLLFNGFRKLALVTNTANSRAAGTLAIEDYLETVKLMGLAGKNAVDKTGVGLIVDLWTHWKSLELAEVKTRDVFAQPTIESGMLTNIYGYPVIATPNMHRANQDATYGLKANTAGKVDLDTASNNATGSILAVRWDQWRFAYKRRMSFEVQRDAISDSSVIVVMMRVGMNYRDTEAAAISYGITL
jgi:hypothetical protein